MTEDIRIVFMSVPREEAKTFAREIITQRLVACVNIIPKMDSFYWWDGQVLTDEESLLIMKTTHQKFAALQEFVERNHPYEIPELLAVEVKEGLPDYLAWVKVESERSSLPD
jgi:periplasmic divalent cation tolerance protein